MPKASRISISARSTTKAKPPAIDATGNDDAPVVKFVNKVLVDAIKRGASDIHFEPYETQLPRALSHGRHAARGRRAADQARRRAFPRV